MDTTRLRRLVGGEIYSLGMMRTHTDIPGLCKALGISTPEEGVKKDRMARCVDALDDADLPAIAGRLLSDFSLRAELRNQLEDLLWSDSGFPSILKRVRREVALALSVEELRKAIPGITQHMLTAQLRELEADGLVSRTVFAEVPPRVEYQITPKARGLGPTMEALTAWWNQYGKTVPVKPVSRGRQAKIVKSKPK